VVRAIGQAVTTFAARALPVLPPEFDAERCGRRVCSDVLQWSCAPSRRSEFARCTRIPRRISDAHRSPRSNARLGSSPPGRYRNPSSKSDRAASVRGWALRRIQGKALSVARLLKASFTFDGGLPYLVWKIERHSGVKVEITPFMRRFPRLGAIGAMWRTWRRGGFR
jgi:hypothetical protein